MWRDSFGEQATRPLNNRYVCLSPTTKWRDSFAGLIYSNIYKRYILLRQLEEQRALQLKQRAEEDEIRKKRAEEDEAFLKLKLDLILEDDNESKISKLSSRASREKVADWLNNGQGGQTVVTTSSNIGANPPQVTAQQPIHTTPSSTSQVPDPVPSTSGSTNVVPTSTSTPQSGKVTSPLQVDIPQASTPQQLGPISSFAIPAEDNFGNSTLPSSCVATIYMGGQSFPLYATSQIPPVIGPFRRSSVQKSIADTNVTFSGKVPPIIPHKHSVLSGSQFGSVSAYQSQSGLHQPGLLESWTGVSSQQALAIGSLRGAQGNFEIPVVTSANSSDSGPHQQYGMHQHSMHQHGIQQHGMQQHGMQQHGMQQHGMQQSNVAQPTVHGAQQMGGPYHPTPSGHVPLGPQFGSVSTDRTQSFNLSGLQVPGVPPFVGASTGLFVVPQPVATPAISAAGTSGQAQPGLHPLGPIGSFPGVSGQQAPIIGPLPGVEGNPFEIPARASANLSGSVPQQHHGTQQSSVPQPAVQGVSPYHAVPSGPQLAARQVMPRELPTFSGDPQDWPLFSSSFYNTTAACGYTDAENLARLQRCLKGNAMDSVKSRLLMPESVPHVMETLRKLYGRPEVLIHALLRRLRSVPSPRTENLQSVITYGMAVRNLVDHMFVAQLQDHLRNPMLLHELVEKLPSQIKMQWSWYKRSKMDVNLATFGDFMSELVNTASDVTLPADASSQQLKPGQTGRDKQKLYVHAETEGGQAASTSTASKPKSSPGVEWKKSCSYCSNDKHEVAGCSQFKALDLDGRWKAIRSKGLCRTCLIPHRKWPCRSAKECGVDGCRMRHHALLHSRATTETAAHQSKPNAKSTTSGENITQQNHHSTLSYCLFRYLPVTLEGNGKQVETYAFLDDGCQTTLMEAGLAADLDIVGPAESLWLGWTGNISREEKGSQRVTVNISGSGLKNKFKLNNVRTVQQLKLQGQSLQYDELRRTYPHLRGLPLRSYAEAVPRLIIGIEHAQLLTPLKVREGKANEPVAVKTRLGWCIYGKQAGDSTAVEQLHVHTEEQQIGNRELHELMKKYFEVEEAAVATPIESADDSRAREILERTTRRTGKGFETGLLWKYDHPTLPDSYPLALRRLQSLEKRLDKDQELREKVISLIREYETKGYAHKLTQEELESTDPNRVWYLPLGVVRNPKKPKKVRLIWDAAARVHGVAFNDMLLKGPDMLTLLLVVLLRFRQRSIAVMGDIREMFHQIGIIPLDKQFQTFLYREHQDLPPQIYVMDVATFGATCSPCSSQFVKNKNAREYESQYPRAAEAIINAHYVDDYLDSVDTVDEAVQLVNEVKHVHALGGFEIRNFSSNSPEVLRQLGETRSPQVESLNLDASAYVEHVLGMVWNPTADFFTFDTALKEDLEKLLKEDILPSKRQILRMVMSLFDPYGLIAHFIVHGKILMQHICRTGTDWDERIATELHGLWRDWTHHLKRLSEVEVPRCFFGEANSKLPASIQLHTFVDASELAYACVSYLRIVQAGVVRCVLVAAKTKVAPLKPLSIPRLELQAGVIGCRLMETICAALNLPIEGRYIWTDSTTALAWIKSDSRRYHPYVAVRVGEILNTTNVDEWHHVPSKQNVADDATKWGSGPDFSPSGRWYTGEAFLYQPMSEWPKQAKNQRSTDEDLRAVFHHHRELPRPSIDVSRFSNWNRLLRTAAYVQRAIHKFRGQKVTGELTSDEMLQAENFLWREVQLHVYPDEYYTLQYNKQHPDESPKQIEKSSALYQESPFMDEAGVIRMNSRISTAPTASFETKYPVILPKDHALTRLLIDSYHRRFLHMHNDTVFNDIRQRFRIPQLRPVVKRVSRDCQYCKIKKAVPRSPMMAPLPAVRLTPHVRAFSYTGIDYFGPILVKQGRSLVKRWVALFTCLTIRAVHLEIVHSLTTQSCVMFVTEGVTLRDSWKLTQYLVDQFWKRWVHEYLPTLTRRTKWFQPTKPLEPGDVVFVVDVNKRNGWLRGRITEVFQGKDGQVRRAVVRTSDGVLTRPAVKLALLDVRPDRKQIDNEGSSELHGRGNDKEPQGMQES